MNDSVFSTGEVLEPTYDIDFNVSGSLARPIAQPLVVDNPVGLVIFGNTSAIYLAHVPDPGSQPYKPLPIIKAHTYIHGWAVNAGKLYVLDGIELSMWDLLTGKQSAKINLITHAPHAAEAAARLGDLQAQIHRVEWATMLEQSEDEFVRITAEQAAAPTGSEERARLDELATDFLKMLTELRHVVGGPLCTANPRAFIQALRDRLTDIRNSAENWLFSTPVIRTSSLQAPLRAIFIMQGNGTLHYCDKGLAESGSKRWNTPRGNAIITRRKASSRTARLQ